MLVKRRQAENSAATRSALLKIARKLFAERGYADTATEEVVKGARVTRGALYHHFKDKQDLFKAVLHEEQLRLASKTGEAASIAMAMARVTGCRIVELLCPIVHLTLIRFYPKSVGKEARCFYF